MPFKNETSRFVALECVDCKSWHGYPASQFRGVQLRHYLRQGYIRQVCSCNGPSADGLGNTQHRVVGYITENQKRLTSGGVTRLLNAMSRKKKRKGR